MFSIPQLMRGGLVCAIVLLAAASRAQPLPGFTLTGENWSYDPGDGGAVITGILSRPATNGLQPAVLISHGKGGNATGFSLLKARMMTNWGAVCIGPNYTHASSTNAPENEGWCPENSRRTRACLTILANLGYVDMARMAAYGNSMGAFVTAGLCGQITNQIRAAAITAGGTSGTSNTDFASPATQEVQGIVSPFLMLHGTADTTVPPAQSATLQFILTGNDVPNDRVLFEGIGHDLHNNPATSDTVLTLIRDWFTQWGVLGAGNPPPVPGPTDFVAHWSFDEGSGATAHDSSANGFHGAVRGAAWTAGVSSNALAFDGMDDHVEFTDGAGYPDRIGALAVGTISVWFKFDATPGANQIHPVFYLGRATGGANRSSVIIEIGHFNAGNTKLYFTVLTPDGTIPLCFDSNTGLAPQTWHHFAAVVGTNFNTGYLNGVEMTNRHYNFGGPTHWNFLDDVAKEVCWAGRGFLGNLTATQHLKGAVDEIRLYDRPLSGVEISNYHRAIVGSVTNPPVAAPGRRPRGLFVLDSASGAQINGVSMRDANLRSYDFLSGYVLRAAWSTLEPAPEVYDFTILSNILARLQPLGQKLSLILVPFEPPYIAATPGVTRWQDVDRNGNPLTRAAPWDPFLLQQRAKFLAALATNQFGGLAFRDHPLLDTINPYLPGGFTGVRDPNTIRLRDLPGYTRSNFLAAVQHELRALTTNFAGKFVQIGFWKVSDYENTSYGGVETWEYIRQQLLAEFNGVIRPRVGFFMENLAASRPAPGQDPVTGFPITSFGTALFLSQTNTWAGFQALGSWSHPFNPAHVDNTTNGTPADGVRYGFETYGGTCFEIYVSDADHAPYRDGLAEWQRRLTTTELRLEMGGATQLRWDRASPVTAIAAATNVAGPYSPVVWLTNRLDWPPPASAGPGRFFYAWQVE
jgi:dienelactone hydrolase